LLAIRFPQDGIKLVNDDRYFIMGIGHLHPNATNLKDVHEVVVATGRQTDWEAESVREGVAKQVWHQQHAYVIMGQLSGFTSHHAMSRTRIGRVKSAARILCPRKKRYFQT